MGFPFAALLLYFGPRRPGLLGSQYRMKLIHTAGALASFAGLSLLLVIATSGCGSRGSADGANAALAQERDRLSTENQALDQARTDNQEVQRLKTELQDLPKVRSQYQEAARLRKENEQLAREVAKLSPHSKTNQPGADARGVASAAGDGSLAQTEGEKKAAPDESTINEQDEVLVDPSILKQLLPAFDWDKVGRTNAVSVRSLIEKDGIQLTNIAQLQDYGITNFVVRRLPPPKPDAK